MSKITEVAVWEPTVYQWDITDPNKAGPAAFDLDGEATDGFANAGVQQVTNRTAYLKEKQDADIANLTAHVGSRGAAHTNATTTEDGFMSASDKTKLNGVTAGAQPNVATNLAQGTRTATTVPVTSSTGTTATLTVATTSLAGVISSADKTKLDGVETGAQVNTVTSVAARTGAVVLTSTDVGLGNVNNTSDANKPVSTAQQTALNLKANLASPALTGTPTAPTATAGTNTTQVATTAFVTAAVTAGGSGTTNLGVTTAASTVTVTSSTGTSAVLPASTTSLAGVQTAVDKTKLDGIAAGAQVNVATNLTYTASTTTGTVNSSTGTSATLPVATTSLSGLLSAVDKTKLDSLSNSTTQLLHVQEQQPNGTAGGTSVSGVFTTRVLNTVVINLIPGASLSANRITLPSGTYYLSGSSPFFATGNYRARVSNFTDTTSVIIGTSESSTTSTQVNRAWVFGAFTLTGTKEIILEYITQTAKSSNGLGVNTGQSAYEVYSDLTIWKIS
jgi:hypothetical protein